MSWVDAFRYFRSQGGEAEMTRDDFFAAVLKVRRPAPDVPDVPPLTDDRDLPTRGDFSDRKV